MPRVLRPRPVLSAAARLRLMWLSSPALPVGGFSYSEGFESAVDAGLVTDEASAGAWLRDQLRLGLARADMAIMATAVWAWQRRDIVRVTELNDWVAQTRETAEFRLQTEQMGRSLVAWLRNSTHGASPDAARGSTHASLDADLKCPHEDATRLAQCAALSPAPTWPIAFALAIAQCLPERSGAMAHDHHNAIVKDALLSYAFGWAENMVQAAIKAVPLGQSAGQRILQSLVDAIPQAIDHACALPEGGRQAFTPMLAILSARHETQYSRLFRS